MGGKQAIEITFLGDGTLNRQTQTLQNSYYKCAQGFNKTHSHNEQRNRNYREKTTDWKKTTTTPVTNMLDGIMSKLNAIEANKIEPENRAAAIILQEREMLEKVNELSISICLKHP